jgi:hypothetical protein
MNHAPTVKFFRATKKKLNRDCAMSASGGGSGRAATGHFAERSVRRSVGCPRLTLRSVRKFSQRENCHHETIAMNAKRPWPPVVFCKGLIQF